MNRKFHIKKGDLVQVNAGEDKGKQGKVLEVFPDKERAIVEGINMISKHTKPNAKYPQGGIIKQEAPIHISNLNVIDPSTNKPTRIGRKKDEKGNLVRYAKKSGLKSLPPPGALSEARYVISSPLNENSSIISAI